METWKTVLDGTYEVSDMGNVRRAIPGISTFIGRPVRGIVSPGGYVQVSLSCSGKKIKRVYVHQLVLLAFVGERPLGHVVNHKDLDKSNNQLSNLEYTTSRENNNHAIKLRGRIRGPKMTPRPLKGKQIGDKHWMKRHPEKILKGEELNSKLTADQVRSIREKRAMGIKYKFLVEEFGISIAHVSRICLNKRWGHI